MSRRPIVLAAAVLLVQILSLRAEIRLSFLTENTSLQSTLNLLRDNGCKPDSLAAFEKAVRNYNSSFTNFDYSKFPKSKDGFFFFESASNLTSVLDKRLCDTAHAYELNCFDTIILLSYKKFHIGKSSDAQGTYLTVESSDSGELISRHVATACEAFSLSYPEWYRKTTGHYFSSTMSDVRISLTASLYSFHMLPISTTERDLNIKAMNVLGADWKNQTIKFPNSLQIVLCHQVNLTNHLFITTHGGLLFKHGKSHTYIEKDGGSGPFVRLDFENKSDLAIWLSKMFIPKAQSGAIATFNDSEIITLPVN